ncbi:sensor histidine kinase [Deinococcus ficus]|uniref:histidine kinase n=1 Tax=Deinococcus ficus TaxID=317577 RepID=A0A221T0M8_9DEIO|nr:HAMP domain-containing sensor histidine kinase [Deinococcus ficus]ASN82445.1 ATP-binding protein [Deinococcus ficus]
MPELRTFLRAQWPQWLFWGLVSGLFLGVGGLAGLPAGFMLYAALLSLAMLVVFQGVLFLRWRRQAAWLAALSMDDPAHLAAYRAQYPLDLAGVTLARFAATYRDAAGAQVAREKEREAYFSLWLHQIKTPLSAMALLLDPAPEEELALTDLRRERLRIEQYVHLALAFLKFERPGADLDIRPVDVDDVIRRALRRQRTLFIGSRTTLKYTPTGLSVISDAAWLDIVIEQVLSNALKYAAGGTIWIHVHPDQPTTLVIADNGPGIRAEDLPRLFERGYAGLAGQGRGGSSGLGLPLSRQICERLGHHLRLESVPGQGTQALLDLGERGAQVQAPCLTRS